MAKKVTFYLLLILFEIVLCAYSLNLPDKEKNRDDKAERKLPDSLLEKNIKSENTPGDVTPNLSILNLATSIRKRRDDTAHRNESFAENLCRRHSFQVKFSDIGMNWIIHPDGMDIGICKGNCLSKQAPIATNNAKLRNLAYEHGLLSEEETPCCVPTMHEPRNVILIDGEGKVHSTTMHDLIITECGCG